MAPLRRRGEGNHGQRRLQACRVSGVTCRKPHDATACRRYTGSWFRLFRKRRGRRSAHAMTWLAHRALPSAGFGFAYAEAQHRAGERCRPDAAIALHFRGRPAVLAIQPRPAISTGPHRVGYNKSFVPVHSRDGDAPKPVLRSHPNELLHRPRSANRLPRPNTNIFRQ